MKIGWLEDFEPKHEKLISLICPHINDGMLAEIARADYERDQEKHLAQIRKIRDGQPVATPMLWHPAEVLELFRWSEPDDPNHRPGRSGVEGHWMRAFACAALLSEAKKPQNESLRSNSSWEDTAVQLVESLCVLGKFQRPATSLLASLIAAYEFEPFEELALLGYALLGIAIKQEADVSDEALSSLIEWCDMRGTSEWSLQHGNETDDWLVSSINSSISKVTWRRISGRLLGDLENRSVQLQERILSVASRLAGS